MSQIKLSRLEDQILPIVHNQGLTTIQSWSIEKVELLPSLYLKSRQRRYDACWLYVRFYRGENARVSSDVVVYNIYVVHGNEKSSSILASSIELKHWNGLPFHPGNLCSDLVKASWKAGSLFAERRTY